MADARPRDAGTVGEWLAARDVAPAPLARRVADVMSERGLLDAPQSAEPWLAAAESLLASLLHDGCATRASALDLLVCDALVTYAFEAGADDPAALDRLTREAMTRIATLADSAVGA